MSWVNVPSFGPASLVEVALKVTFVLGLCWLADFALRRQSAAKRHCVWLAGILSALVLPFLAMWIPFPFPAPLGHAAAGWLSEIAARPAVMLFMQQTGATAQGERLWHVHIATLLILIWTSIAFLLALRLVAGLMQLGKIAANSEPVREGEWKSLVEELSSAVGLRRPIRVLLSRSPRFIPVTWGLVRPLIVLPSDAPQWSLQRRRIVLAHEFAHVARCDWFLQIWAEFACCLYWFHPLAWMAARKLRQESEQACDDAVLNVSVPASEYARELLEIVQRLGTSRRKWAMALAMARPSRLERRLEAMLDPSVNRKRVSVKMNLLVACATLCLLLPLAALPMPALVESSGAPGGWFLAGSKPENYLTGIDSEVSRSGQASAYLKSKPSATQGFGTLMQSFSAGQYLGRRVRLSAEVRTEDVSDGAGLWMRVDRGPQSVAFDNMQNRPIKGTTNWRQYDVVLDVPADATAISFGVLLSKGGAVWLSGVKFEIVGNDVSTTGVLMSPLKEQPTNLSFDQK